MRELNEIKLFMETLIFCLVIIVVRSLDVRGAFQPRPNSNSVSEPFMVDDDSESERRSSKRKFGYLESIELDNDYVQGSLWPKPFNEDRCDTVYYLNCDDFQFIPTGFNSSILNVAFERYMKLTFPIRLEPPSTDKFIQSLDVNVTTNNTELSLDMDESYELHVRFPNSRLNAATVWGALRGLETFSQIVYRSKKNLYVAKKTSVKDKPRFKHRGFLIDTSRHYLSVKTIFKFLDAMSYSKFNVLHWHIVDDPSFPFISSRFPELSEEGSKNPVTHVYTQQNVQDIINYARYRGIRVIPEFDTPGHTKSWKGIPGLLTDCNEDSGLIDPTKEENYEFLESFFGEISKVFPDKYIHLGADEVEFRCWEKDKEIKKWMKKHNIKSYKILEQYYSERLIKIAEKLEKKYIVWQDIFDNNVTLHKDTVVNIWLPDWEEKIANVAKKGYKAILSSCWYLNYINYGIDWPEYYFCDPEHFSGTAEQKKLIMGGTAAIWGEYVDATNILPRTWGRGLAVGERLWSPKSQRNIVDAMQRIWEHRCRYLSRGIPAEPVLKARFCNEEWEN